MRHAAKWMAQVRNGRNCTGGKRCASRTMSGVAKAHGTQPSTTARNRSPHAWCMPSARMPNTVWVASKSAIADQMTALQNHDDRVRELPVSIGGTLLYGEAGQSGNAAK